MTESRGIRVRRGTRQRWLNENQGRHFCHCGCGKPIQLRAEHFNEGVPRFVHGHNAKGRPRKHPAPVSLPCACGCGALATPGRRYLSGHNNVGQKRSVETRRKLSESKRGALNPMYGRRAANAKELPAPEPCACGCGANASPGRRFISGHNGRGQRTSRYTGRMVVNGYVQVYRPDHPFAHTRGWIAEHRVVMEDHLRQHDPESPHLHEIMGELYLLPELLVHHIDADKSNNVVGNLTVLTRSEHTALHHAQGDIRG